MEATVASGQPVRTDDHAYMEAALAEARQAALDGEVPVGAVLVKAGKILAAARNASISLSDPTAHAEIMALRMAGRADGNYRLSGTTLYVTVEPCVMCVGAIMHARVQRIVFGCREPKAGALGSVLDLARHVWGNHRVEVSRGPYADEAARLMQVFFRLRRGA